jgi:hypothetical protein
MSGHGTPEEMQKEVDKWFKLSIGIIIYYISLLIYYHYYYYY